MVLPIIYGAWVMFLLFWYHQDTESEYWEMKIGEAGLILTQKKIPKAIRDKNIHTIQYGWKMLW